MNGVTCRLVQVGMLADVGSLRVELTVTTETPAACWMTQDWPVLSSVMSFEPDKRQIFPVHVAIITMHLSKQQ